MGTIPALLDRSDFIILDKLSHACLIDAAKLSAATMRVFPHNHLDKLRQILHSIRAQHGAGPRILIITESVFSMDGDTAPLREIVELKDCYDAWLLVDEAHGFGIFGKNGGGLSEELGLQSRIEIQMGTLSKAAGLAGGFMAGSSQLIDLLINRARSFLYSTAPPPALAHAANTSLSLIRSQEGRDLRQKLQANLQEFHQDLSPRQHCTPIVPVILGDNDTAIATAEELMKAGYRVPAIRYPTVPRNQARLRISLSAVHTKSALHGLRSQLARICSSSKFGIDS
jgi:7-keto-8-aminopelargonate synthetase-like enzyme